MIAVIGIPIGSSLLMLYPLLPGLMANIPFLGGMLLFLAMLTGTGAVAVPALPRQPAGR